MRRLIAAVSLMIFGISAQAGGMTNLKFADGTIHAHVTWTQGPRSPDESTLRIEWMNGVSHSPMQPPGDFKVVLWMPDMNHGSSPTQIEQALDSQGQPMVGVYAVTSIFFIMGGEWDVNVLLTLADGSVETQTLKVEIDGGHHLSD